MSPLNWLRTDVNYDAVVNIADIGLEARAFGSSVGDVNWNAKCDFNNDKTINIVDLATAASDFGKKMIWTP